MTLKRHEFFKSEMRKKNMRWLRSREMRSMGMDTAMSRARWLMCGAYAWGAMGERKDGIGCGNTGVTIRRLG